MKLEKAGAGYRRVSGLGKSIALKLAENRADIAVIYVGDEAPALEVCREIEAMGRRAKAYFCDVRDESCGGNGEGSVRDLGKADILVNNAGVTRDGLMLTMKDEDYDLVLDINLRARFPYDPRLLPRFHEEKIREDYQYQLHCGHGGKYRPGQLCCLKAGLIGLSKSVAKELGSRGVCCNCIAPALSKRR